MTQPSQATRRPEWSPEDLTGYRAGTTVTHHGRTYRARPWPADAWARQAAYEPGGPDAWRCAWEEIPAEDSPQPRRGAHARPAAPEPPDGPGN